MHEGTGQLMAPVRFRAQVRPASPPSRRPASMAHRVVLQTSPERPRPRVARQVEAADGNGEVASLILYTPVKDAERWCSALAAC